MSNSESALGWAALVGLLIVVAAIAAAVWFFTR